MAHVRMLGEAGDLNRGGDAGGFVAGLEGDPCRDVEAGTSGDYG